MRLIRMIGRDIRDAVKSVFRNFSLSMASISCIIITLILVALALISSYNVDNFTKLMQKDFTIVVFLNKDITDKETDVVKKQIEEDKNVTHYKYKSKVEIANSMMESSDAYKSIMQNWTADENPLMSTISVYLKDVTQITETAKRIEKLDNVKTVQYGDTIVSKFLSFFNIIEKVLIAIVVLFVIVTAFLIANTIKLTIFSRRREIEIMRLVGASNFNIELPFVVEGLFLGILGSIIPICLVIYGYSALYLHFEGQMISPFLKLIKPEPFIYQISLVLLGIGILVGMFGSFRAVRKYLKI